MRVALYVLAALVALYLAFQLVGLVFSVVGTMISWSFAIVKALVAGAIVLLCAVCAFLLLHGGWTKARKRIGW